MRIWLHPPLGFRHMLALQPQTLAQALSSAIPARSPWEENAAPEYPSRKEEFHKNEASSQAALIIHPPLSPEQTLFGSRLEMKCNRPSLCPSVIKFLSLNASCTLTAS